MKNKLFLLGLLGSVFYNAQTGNVGINTDQPTEVLDVNGNGRVRSLADGANTTDFPRVVVAKTDGTLGYRASEVVLTRPIVLNLNHTATGLVWNTKNNNSVPIGNPDAVQGTQDNFPYYLVFGTKNDVSATSAGYTSRGTTFSASGGEVLDISSVLSFGVYNNFSSNVTLSSAVPQDRQVIIYLYLYKGDTMLKKLTRIVNFNGRSYTDENTILNDATKRNGYDFNEEVSMRYLVPTAGSGTDYSVSVVVTAKAPKDGQFRISFAPPFSQYLMVTK